jgi:GT2 family glycosyltransferase
MYFDEVDLCYRIKKSGWQIRFFPQVVVTHHWGRSTSQAAINMNKQWYLSFFKYLKKNRHYPDWVCSLVLSLMIWLKLCVALSVIAFMITAVLQVGGVFR